MQGLQFHMFLALSFPKTHPEGALSSLDAFLWTLLASMKRIYSIHSYANFTSIGQGLGNDSAITILLNSGEVVINCMRWPFLVMFFGRKVEISWWYDTRVVSDFVAIKVSTSFGLKASGDVLCVTILWLEDFIVFASVKVGNWSGLVISSHTWDSV